MQENVFMAPQSIAKVNDSEIANSISGGGQDRRKGEEQLFKNFSYFINEAIRKYFFTHDEAFDVYSDTILNTIDNIRGGSFEGRSSLKTYVFQVFHNKCVDMIRKKKSNKNSVNKTVALTDLPAQLSDEAKSVIQKIMDRSDWESLKLKLSELGENCRKLLLLWADGYTDKEIVTSVEYKTADVVKTSRLRCLEKLRQFYKKREH